MAECLGGVEGISEKGFKEEWSRELQAMDEFARIRSIAFQKWIESDDVIFFDASEKEKNPQDRVYYTHEQLYSLFMEQSK